MYWEEDAAAAEEEEGADAEEGWVAIEGEDEDIYIYTERDNWIWGLGKTRVSVSEMLWMMKTKSFFYFGIF